MAHNNDQRIEIILESANGPKVVFKDGTDIEDIVSEIPVGWTISETENIRTSDGRWSQPLVRCRYRIWTEGEGDSLIVDADSLEDALDRARELAGDIDLDGRGAIITVNARALNYFEEEVGELAEDEVAFEPDHEALIAAAGGDPDCEHEWVATYEIEGGLQENPGVMSLGGTVMRLLDHCERCGIRRRRTEYGSQRNPGQQDEVEYWIHEELN